MSLSSLPPSFISPCHPPTPRHQIPINTLITLLPKCLLCLFLATSLAPHHFVFHCRFIVLLLSIVLVMAPPLRHPKTGLSTSRRRWSSFVPHGVFKEHKIIKRLQSRAGWRAFCALLLARYNVSAKVSGDGP